MLKPHGMVAPLPGKSSKDAHNNYHYQQHPRHHVVSSHPYRARI